MKTYKPLNQNPGTTGATLDDFYIQDLKVDAAKLGTLAPHPEWPGVWVDTDGELWVAAQPPAKPPYWMVPCTLERDIYTKGKLVAPKGAAFMPTALDDANRTATGTLEDGTTLTLPNWLLKVV